MMKMPGITLSLLLGLVFIPARAQVGLPITAISIPADQSIAAGIQSAGSCELQNKVIVLPAIPFHLTADESASRLLEGQTQAVNGTPKTVDLWLHVGMGGDPLTGKETEKQLIDGVDGFLKSLPLSSPAVRGLVVEVKEPQATPDLYAFELLRLALVAKSGGTNLRLAFVFEAGFIGRHESLVKRLATYADLLGTTYTPGWKKDAAWIAEQALNKPLILKLNRDVLASEVSSLTATLAASDAFAKVLWAEPADSKTADRVCAVNSFMAHYITGKMQRIASASVPFSLTMDGGEGETRWFDSGQSPDMLVVARVKGTLDQPKTVTLQGDGLEKVDRRWFDPATGKSLPADELTKTSNGWVQTCRCTSDYVLIALRQQNTANAPVYNAVDVQANSDLSVEEIVARWQRYREAQREKLANYQSSSFMNLHFESTNFVSAFDVSMRFKQFYDRDGKMEFGQTEFYVNGVKFDKKYQFPLPQLEPEKVLTQPLELTVSERYEYKLLGKEQVDGTQCYVVSVEPKVLDETLYSGKVWIDSATFREVKQILSQRGQKSNVVINLETQNFALVSDGKGHQFNLPSTIYAQQTLNAAGRDFLLQRKMQFSEYVINSSQFNDALEAEHNTDDPMYRETDNGLRILKKQGNERVVQEIDEKRIRSLISGAMYGGTFNFPIPYLGISIVDFDYRHTGAQLSTFFAGPILDTDLSKRYGNKFRLAADLALNAIPNENRIYNGNIENTAEQVWTWEEDTGLRATWQATPHLGLTGSTYLSYFGYLKTSDTASQYQLPRDGVSLIPGVQLKFTEKGYEFTGDVSRGQRISWRQFGYASSAQLPQAGYTLYDADFTKDYNFKKFTEGGWDFSYYGGNQLDRFSRYFPSYFSVPRLHGIPSGTDTFDAIAMGTVHYGFNAMNLIKIEELYSYARARNLEESNQFRLFDGLETNFSTAGPWGTLIQGTVSYAIDGNIDRYNSRWGANILILKPLR